ncbi:L-2-hydroxyglutarate oxidase [Candidatus Riflebacteria bacterium]
MVDYDITVIGGGIIGLATAWCLKESFPLLKIILLEKEKQVGMHQSGHNSGVIHSGLYYKPGSAKARNCVLGRKLLIEFAKKHNIPFEICGKIVVATRVGELPFLEKIYARGLANGLAGLKKINSIQIRAREPFCRGIAGLWVPETGIIDYPGVMQVLTRLLKAGTIPCQLRFNYEVTSIRQGRKKAIIKTHASSINTRYYIACAGLHADRLAHKDNMGLGLSIVPFRGDYKILTAKAQHMVKNLIYPVPNPQFPFLGVHFTRMIDDRVECGPNAVFSFKREGYGKWDFNSRDTLEALGFPGTQKLFIKNWRFGCMELARAISKRLFLKQLKRLLPNIKLKDLEEGRSGVRAAALDLHGALVDDFKIETTGRGIHVLNAPSPAATACFAIAEKIKKMALKHFKITAR